MPVSLSWRTHARSKGQHHPCDSSHSASSSEQEGPPSSGALVATATSSSSSSLQNQGLPLNLAGHTAPPTHATPPCLVRRKTTGQSEARRIALTLDRPAYRVAIRSLCAARSSSEEVAADTGGELGFSWDNSSAYGGLRASRNPPSRTVARRLDTRHLNTLLAGLCAHVWRRTWLAREWQTIVAALFHLHHPPPCSFCSFCSSSSSSSSSSSCCSTTSSSSSSSYSSS